MKAVLLRATCCVAILAWSGAGACAEGDLPFDLNAFGTLGVAHSSEDQADYTRNVLVPSGAGGTHGWSPKIDSVMAGQVSGHFSSRLSALVQVVFEQRADDSFDPRLEWANLKYAITPDLSVAVGRIVSPILLFTDTRRVSYSLAWIRPPQEVYELYPVTNSDGVNLLWRSRLGEATHTLELAYGNSDTKYSRAGQSGRARATRQMFLRSTLERGAATVSVGISPSRLTLPAFEPLFDAYRQFGPAGEAIADRYSADHRAARFLGAGVNYDPGRWFVIAEWAQEKVRGVIGSHSGWYASSGWRFGSLTPYAIWGQTRPLQHRSDPGVDPNSVPPESAAVVGALNAQLNALLANVPEQSSLSVGARWDFMTNLCLKVQYDHVDFARGNSGTLTRFKPGFRPGGSTNVLGLSMSFVL
jgi:hypothetical protein